MNKKITKNKLWHVILISLLLFFNAKVIKAQGFYPVQSSVQLVPPYSTYLTDYAQPGSEKFRVILLQKDISQTSYQLRLRFSIILDGKTIMITSRSYNPPPLTLAPGIPTTITGADLADYLDSRYLDFVGYDRSLYERTKSLPEGSFQICVTAYDYHRQNVQISNVGCSFYYLAKNEPPLINQPACGSRIIKKEPQQIVFTWLPRNTSSPNSANSTEYIFQLFENRVPGKNPNDIALSQPPVFTTTTDLPQIIYGPAEPQLLENMQYVWRVQAIDKGGKDDFRNNGYSEVCTFTYGGENLQDIGLVKEFNAEGVNERVGRMHWKLEPDIFDSYKITFKKTSSPDGQWGIAESTTSEVTVNTLEPGTEYETRIQGKKNGFYGNYSSIITFKTPVKRVVNCNPTDPSTAKADFTKPLLDGINGTIVKASDMDVMLLNVVNLGNGYYKGLGKVYIDFLAGAAFEVYLDNVFIDQNKIVGAGKITSVSKGADYVKNTNDPLAHQNKLELKGDLKTLVQELKGIDTASAPTLIRWIETIESVTQETIGNTLVLTKAEKDKFTQTQKELTAAKANLKSKPTDVTLIKNIKDKIKEATPALTKMSQYLGKGLWLSLGLIKEKAVEEILQGFEKEIEVYLKIPENERNSKTRGPADEENNFRLNLPVCLQDKSNEELKSILVSIDNELKIEKKNERPFTKMVLEKYPDFYKDLENTVKPKLKSETDKIEEKVDAGQWTKNKENVCSVMDKMDVSAYQYVIDPKNILASEDKENLNNTLSQSGFGMKILIRRPDDKDDRLTSLKNELSTGSDKLLLYLKVNDKQEITSIDLYQSKLSDECFSHIYTEALEGSKAFLTIDKVKYLAFYFIAKVYFGSINCLTSFENAKNEASLLSLQGEEKYDYLFGAGTINTAVAGLDVVSQAEDIAKKAKTAVEECLKEFQKNNFCFTRDCLKNKPQKFNKKGDNLCNYLPACDINGKVMCETAKEMVSGLTELIELAFGEEKDPEIKAYSRGQINGMAISFLAGIVIEKLPAIKLAINKASLVKSAQRLKAWKGKGYNWYKSKITGNGTTRDGLIAKDGKGIIKEKITYDNQGNEFIDGEWENGKDNVPGDGKDFSNSYVVNPIKILDASLFESWYKNLPDAPVNRPDNIRFQYQKRITGTAIEKRVTLKGPPINAGPTMDLDGVKMNESAIIEAKYIEKPNKSPYIEGSSCPDFVRESAINDINKEMIKYYNIISDPTNPARELIIITNEAKAKGFFEKKLRQFNIPGKVIIKE